MKIYSKGNYVHIVDVNGKLLSAVKKEVEILPTNDEKTEYKIFGFKDLSPRDSFSLHHFVKEDGSAFTLTQWEDFYMANTGNYGSEPAPPATDYTPKLDEIITAIENNKEKELIKPITEFTETIVGTDYEYLLLNTGIKIINSVEMGEEENINNTKLIYEIITGTSDVKLTTSVQIPSNYFIRITGPK